MGHIIYSSFKANLFEKFENSLKKFVLIFLFHFNSSSKLKIDTRKTIICSLNHFILLIHEMGSSFVVLVTHNKHGEVLK